MIDVKSAYCGNHLTIYINQTIMLYTLNLYNNVYQLFLNRIGGKKATLKKREDNFEIILGFCQRRVLLTILSPLYLNFINPNNSQV